MQGEAGPEGPDPRPSLLGLASLAGEVSCPLVEDAEEEEAKYGEDDCEEEAFGEGFYEVFGNHCIHKNTQGCPTCKKKINYFQTPLTLWCIGSLPHSGEVS